MKTTRALLGVAVGFVAGALIGVLFAPRTGADTRKQTLKLSRDLAKAMNNEIDRKFGQLIRMIGDKRSFRRTPDAEGIDAAHPAALAGSHKS